uniref:Uncharacterized protein n=1 Tax=Zooxanthella nutricula TaxID=1333877 RepID=A0A6U6WAW6_9DINO|mmetsp:Transcript_92631/g.283683  ORF Transcript_92631/g.283683 Transcript_92631/m.283683 type:complete len:100 (+) Transcript_92631:69-368(+)
MPSMKSRTKAAPGSPTTRDAKMKRNTVQEMQRRKTGQFHAKVGQAELAGVRAQSLGRRQDNVTGRAVLAAGAFGLLFGTAYTSHLYFSVIGGGVELVIV